MMIKFSIPGEPVPKARPRFTRNGHAYTQAKTRTYEEIVRLHATQAMRGKKMLTGAIELDVTFYFPIPKSLTKAIKAQAMRGDLAHQKKPDFDNCAKAISDACNKVVYNDDAQITDAHVYKRYSEFPRVEITIKGI